MPAPGQHFNPFRMFTGCFVPNWLMSFEGISPSGKLLYARLAQYAGENGEAWPSVQSLAGDLTITTRHIGRLLSLLVEKGLVEVCPRYKDDGGQTSNGYRFVWHEKMDEALTPRHVSHPPPDIPVIPPLTKMSAKENHVRESVESPVHDLERETLTTSGVQKDNGLLSLSQDTPTARWLNLYLHHRPTSGHPLAKLQPADRTEAIMRVEDLIATCTEARAILLLNEIFEKRPHPVSVTQAVYFCQKILETEREAAFVKPTGWAKPIDKWDPKKHPLLPLSERE